MDPIGRRELLAAVSLSLSETRAGAAVTDLDFASALDAAEAIRRKQISSLELSRRTFARIDRLNPKLNAFAYQLRDDALARAQTLDEASARGKQLGPLHGVPIHIKESFGIAGHPCTWGFPQFRDSKAAQNSDAVERLLGAGAVLIGATNVPVGLSDTQTYNPIYGTTNNPWDLGRTPGGSSGGSAAALAAGIGYLSVGSDIGGSIRTPAHFCGVYGHKPTLDLVSTLGQLPGGVRTTPGFSTLLAVAGPMARSARDLLTALQILGGPIDSDAKAWTWKMPPPRARTLEDFRAGYVLDDPFAPVSSEMKAAFEKMIHGLEKAGVQLQPGWPKGFEPGGLLENYLFLLNAFLFSVKPKEQQQAERDAPDAKPGLGSFAGWQQQNLRRLAFRAQWQAYFEKVDVFLTPVAFTPAFHHDRSEPQSQRVVETPEGKLPYWNILHWIAAPTLTGCPATSAPIGHTAGGLPVNIQIMGPFWEDATPIEFAGLMAQELGGFVPPPGY